MGELWKQLQDNLFFVCVCVIIITAIALLARFAERVLLEKRQISGAKRISIVGICSAIAVVLHILDFPLLFLAPEFYKLDFSEVPVLLCGFYLGPSAAVACEGIKILLKLLFKSTSTAFVGDFANFVVGCSLVLPAIIIYHLHRTRRSAIIGLVIGTLVLTVFGSTFNAIYLLPKFAELFGMPLDAIVGKGTIINSHVNSVSTFVLLCVAPLNLIKGVAVSVLTLLLYKHVARPLFGKSK